MRFEHWSTRVKNCHALGTIEMNNRNERYMAEIEEGKRFAFGKNWARFLSALDERKIVAAEQSLRDMLKIDDWRRVKFLDIGSGSGLFSLAARRLGAVVRSVDFDAQSVACARELKRRYFPEDSNWIVEQASVLDKEFISSAGKWDIVYSWGVLHHTGDMSLALSNASELVLDHGAIYISIYNDQGSTSLRWLAIKKLYNRLPNALRWLILAPAMFRLWGWVTVRDLIRGRPFQTWRDYSSRSVRGMLPWRDVVDWVGGLPFEVATPEKIFYFFKERGFVLQELRTCGGGHGCNEFVLRKMSI